MRLLIVEVLFHTSSGCDMRCMAASLVIIKKRTMMSSIEFGPLSVSWKAST